MKKSFYSKNLANPTIETKLLFTVTSCLISIIVRLFP